MQGHDIDYMPTYQLPDLITFLFCAGMAVVNVRKARRCMRLLDIHADAKANGSIHQDSISFHQARNLLHAPILLDKRKLARHIPL